MFVVLFFFILFIYTLTSNDIRMRSGHVTLHSSLRVKSYARLNISTTRTTSHRLFSVLNGSLIADWLVENMNLDLTPKGCRQLLVYCQKQKKKNSNKHIILIISQNGCILNCCLIIIMIFYHYCLMDHFVNSDNNTISALQC